MNRLCGPQVWSGRSGERQVSRFKRDFIAVLLTILTTLSHIMKYTMQLKLFRGLYENRVFCAQSFALRNRGEKKKINFGAIFC